MSFELALPGSQRQNLPLPVRDTVPVMKEQIYGCSLWLINYHLPWGGAIVFAPAGPEPNGRPSRSLNRRLLNTMANLRQDRVPDRTLSPAPAPANQGPVLDGKAISNPRAVVLSIRLQTQDSSGSPAAVSWKNDSPAVALILDLVAASGGAAEPAEGTALPANFLNLQSALLTARRIAWALQGLAESGAGRNAVATIMIHLEQDTAGGPVTSLLEKAAPGQVLVSDGVAAMVQQLPSAALRETGERNGHELLWRSPEVEWSYSADEQSVLRLIRELGREDPCAPKAETLGVAGPVTTEAAAPATQTSVRSRPVPAAWAAGDRKKWLIAGGAAAVVVLGAVLVIPGLVSGKHEKTSGPPPDRGTRTGQLAPANPPQNGNDQAGGEKPRQTKPPISSMGKQPRHAKTDTKTDSKPDARTESPPQNASCDLTEGEIPRSLSRAESLMYAGKLAESQAAYQKLLGCPSAREKASEGLQKVKQRIAAQSP